MKTSYINNNTMRILAVNYLHYYWCKQLFYIHDTSEGQQNNYEFQSAQTALFSITTKVSHDWSYCAINVI